MFKILLFSLLLISCERENVTEIQSKYFLKFYDIDFKEDIGYDIHLTPDGGYIIAGTTQNPQGNSDILLIKVDKYGNQATWSPLVIEGTGNNFGKAVDVVDDGYIIAGSADSLMILKKINLNGEEVWCTSCTNKGMLNDLEIADGKIFTVGYIETDGIKRPFRAAFDLLGTLNDLSMPPYVETGDFFTSMVQKGSYTSCYGTQFRSNQSNISIIEHGAGGTFSSQETVFQEPLREYSTKINTGSSDKYFIVGTINPINTGSAFTKIFIKKLNSDYSTDNSFSHIPLENAMTEWGGDFRGTEACEMEDGSIVVLGDRSASNDINIILFFLAPDGTVKFTKTFGKSGDQTASALQITPDNGIIILGVNYQEVNAMITLIKTDSKGEIWE